MTKKSAFPEGTFGNFLHLSVWDKSIFTSINRYIKHIKTTYKKMKPRFAIATAILLLGFSTSSLAQMIAYANIFAQVVAPVGIQLSNTPLTGYKSSIVPKGVQAFDEADGIISDHRIIPNKEDNTVISYLIAANNQTFDVSLPNKKLFFRDENDNKMEMSIISNNSTVQLWHGSRVIEVFTVINPSENLVAAYNVAPDPLLVTLNYN